MWVTFWSMDGGIALIMILSMLPTGSYQFYQKELGRILQDLLLAGFGLWVLVLFRGAQNFITWENMCLPPRGSSMAAR